MARRPRAVDSHRERSQTRVSFFFFGHVLFIVYLFKCKLPSTDRKDEVGTIGSVYLTPECHRKNLIDCTDITRHHCVGDPSLKIGNGHSETVLRRPRRRRTKEIEMVKDTHMTRGSARQSDSTVPRSAGER
ncbi:Hypothetical protein SMAX5B_017339 [Scophthalmus maximus]|uniref:Uncharacterized protein n=1 Tax=Scophthalmus maximus TaxID=52904 RepID=A0A2U9CP76_SCOMX|nr:Hypothetical protein SMAX5B_017339 [Scophthalmus maximus]